MKIRVWMDTCGDINGRPVNGRVARKIARHMEEMTGNLETTFFVQEGMGVEEFLQDLPPRHRRDLEHGGPVVFNVDPWVVGHWYGWDTHTLFE